jgi:hypothetical protein
VAIQQTEFGWLCSLDHDRRDMSSPVSIRTHVLQAVDSMGRGASRGPMTDRPTSPRWIGTDVLVGLGWLALTWSVVALSPGAERVRALVVAPVLFVVPGYALQAALFADSPGLTGLERVVVSVALSVAGAVAVGLALGVTVGITAVGSLLGLSVLTVGGFALAVARDSNRELTVTARHDGYAPVRHASSLIPSPGGAPTEESTPVSRTVGALIVFVGGIGILVTVFLFGIHQPPGSATLALGPAEGPWNGSTTGIDAGDPIRVSLTHSYPDRRSFVVVAVLQHTGPDGVTDVRELEQIPVELDSGERWSRVRDPSIDGDRRVRLTYRLYSGTAATGEPRTNAHLWFGPTNTSTATTTPTSDRAGQPGRSPRLIERRDATTGGRL